MNGGGIIAKVKNLRAKSNYLRFFGRANVKYVVGCSYAFLKVTLGTRIKAWEI